jgi:hypothetical protein
LKPSKQELGELNFSYIGHGPAVLRYPRTSFNEESLGAACVAANVGSTGNLFLARVSLPLPSEAPEGPRLTVKSEVGAGTEDNFDAPNDTFFRSFVSVVGKNRLFQGKYGWIKNCNLHRYMQIQAASDQVHYKEHTISSIVRISVSSEGATVYVPVALISWMMPDRLRRVMHCVTSRTLCTTAEEARDKALEEAHTWIDQHLNEL